MLLWGWLVPVIATAAGESRAEGVAGLYASPEPAPQNAPVGDLVVEALKPWASWVWTGNWAVTSVTVSTPSFWPKVTGSLLVIAGVPW